MTKMKNQKNLLELLTITNTDLANRLGISRNQLYKYIAGKTPITGQVRENLLTFCNEITLGCDLFENESEATLIWSYHVFHFYVQPGFVRMGCWNDTVVIGSLDVDEAKAKFRELHPNYSRIKILYVGF